ncbi:hypothetical protein [Aquabacterium sp.]|uniref:hypothetical protein n=1 Tax=Aquabacterium sp. TaxID=1872578 RepID=UPI003783FA70
MLRNPVFPADPEAEAALHIAIARFKANPESDVLMDAYLDAYVALHCPNSTPQMKAARRGVAGGFAVLYRLRERHPNPSELAEVDMR